LPLAIDVLSPEQEAELLLALIHELNDKFNLDLSDDIEVADKDWAKEEAAESKNIKKFIVVGSSHAARLAVALEDVGHYVETITQPGLTLTPETVKNLVHMIEDKVRCADPDTCIVYFLYDNNIYLSEAENGEKSLPPKPRGSEVYHVEGKLVTASRDEFK
jgi:hypothetical protein